MSAGAWMMLLVCVIVLAVLAFLAFSLARGIRDERSGRSIAKEFGLGLVLLVLFLASWAGQALVQWQTFTDEQLAHGESVKFGDFLASFGQSTLENWQSEFLQLFAFVVLAGLYIYRGSAESKDGDERLEASLRRIEQHLGTLPANAPEGPDERWKLPDAPPYTGGADAVSALSGGPTARA